MKTRFMVLGIVFIFLLTGCSNEKENVVANRNERVNRLTEQAFLINSIDHEFIKDLSTDTAKDIVYQMKDENYKLIEIDESYGEITEGLTDSSDGKKTNCYKLPVTFSFHGNEELVTDFIDSLKNRDEKIVMNSFDINEQNGEYDVDCIISFIGSSANKGASGVSSSLTLVKNDKAVKEEEEIVLRDFDVNLTIRPSNSDAAAVVISTQSGNALYSDENERTSVVVDFYKEGKNSYCKYTVGNQSKTDKLSVSNEVKFDVLSCKKMLKEDEIKVDLKINNSLLIPVNVVVYNDDNKRVEINKVGNVEVSRK